jgi:hypothetical protein
MIAIWVKTQNSFFETPPLKAVYFEKPYPLLIIPALTNKHSS